MLPLAIIIPPLTQPLLIIIILQVTHLDPPALALHFAEYPVLVVAKSPVQCAQLGRAFYAAGRRL